MSFSTTVTIAAPHTIGAPLSVEECVRKCQAQLG